jgi:hypothetical protein
MLMLIMTVLGDGGNTDSGSVAMDVSPIGCSSIWMLNDAGRMTGSE